MTPKVRRVAPLTIGEVASAAYDVMASVLHAAAPADRDSYKAARDHAYGRVAHRAALMEAINPEPSPVADCKGVDCRSYRDAAPERKPIPKSERIA